MIRYALTCDLEHGFEGWFGSSADYDDQSARGLVECPVCGSRSVRKQIMAPAVRTRGAAPAPEPAPPPAARKAVREFFAAVRRRVEENFDYVGDAFAREARDIHEGRSEARPIYGEATPSEARDLAEAGVPVAPLPPRLPDEDELN